MKKIFLMLSLLLIINQANLSQPKSNIDSTVFQGTLNNCIKYAIQHQPILRQSLLDESIANQTIKSKLADWFPQLNFNFNIQHNYLLSTSISQGNPIKIGLYNNSSGMFSLTQTIFNRDVLLAASTAGLVRNQVNQITASKKIDIVVNVSKAFYSVLSIQEQNKLIDEDILRLTQSMQDAFNQYKSGVVDKTDYEKATIALNNAQAEQKQNLELLKSGYSALKFEMGYPSKSNLKIESDSLRMVQNIYMDTTQSLNYENRIEYKLIQTQHDLQKANLRYYIWSFLPSVTAYGEYNFNYQNNSLPNLYNKNYPNSYIGLELSLPIFQGGKRLQDIDQAELELERSNYDIINLKNSINNEYELALDAYKSNWYNYVSLKDNLKLANDVYNTVELQYKSGIKTYLDVISAETDLRTTEVNLINAVYQLLSSKLDLQKALGTIQF